MIRLRISPIPIDLTPGSLSNGISQQAKILSSELSVLTCVLRIRAILAIALHRSSHLMPNCCDESMRLHPSASRFEGPAAHFVLTAAFRMRSPSRLLNTASFTFFIGPSNRTSL